MSRRSFIVSASATALTGVIAASLPAQAVNYLQSDLDYPIPTAPQVNEFNLKLELVADQSDDFMKVVWEIAIDSEFNNIINQDSVSLKQDTPQVINLVLNDVPGDVQVFYRLTCERCDAYEISELPFEQGININNLSLTRSDKKQ